MQSPGQRTLGCGRTQELAGDASIFEKEVGRFVAIAILGWHRLMDVEEQVHVVLSTRMLLDMSFRCVCLRLWCGCGYDIVFKVFICDFRLRR